MIRLFVGIELPDKVRSDLAAICSGVPGARWVARENLHLTLRFIGNVEESAVADIDLALSRLKAPAFDLVIAGIDQFCKGRRPTMLWAGVDKNPALSHLQARVETAMQRAGLPPEGRRFTPHVTLARLRNVNGERLRTFIAANALYRSEPIRVDRITLFSSFLAHSGAIYRVEAEYALDATAPAGAPAEQCDPHGFGA